MSKGPEYYQQEYGDGDERVTSNRKHQRGYRKFPLNRAEEDGDIISPESAPALVNLPSTTQLITDALRYRLAHISTPNHTVVEYADIYQRAIDNLATTLSQLSSTDLPDNLREQSDRELVTLAQILEMLFSGQIHLLLRLAEEDTHSLFEGYFKTSDGQDRRVTIYQNLQDQYFPGRQRPTHMSCQIHTNPMAGISTEGRLIAASNQAQLRCGLRYRGNPKGDNQWMISIDSGFRTRRDATGHRKWKDVASLSQAIKMANDSLLPNLNREDDHYTFHYADPRTDCPNGNTKNVEDLQRFIAGLNEIFQGMVINHRDMNFSKGLKVV